MSDRYEHEDVEVRRDGPLAAVVGLGAAALAIAYLTRAVGTDGGWLDWVLMAVLGGIAVLYLAAFLDARAPLLLADQQGIRMRSGRSWRGVAWTEVERVEHLPRSGLLRDGRIVVVTDGDRELTLRLSLATRLVGADWDELTDALRDLAGTTTEVVELEPFPDDLNPGDGPPADASSDDGVPPERSRPYSPTHLRRIAVGVRAEMRHLTSGANALKHHPVALPVSSLPEVHELQRDPDADWVESVIAIGAVAEPEPESTVVIEDLRSLPEPVIGPVLAAARRRLNLSVDQVAERTRIRPHVIESIEIDDFAPCGGDFYARGHLRTLARVLGTDAAPLLRSYDEHYVDAPIDARRIFEAELATGKGGSIRGTRGGLNWSVLVAAVMAAVLVWSVARLIEDGPVELGKAPVLNGSPSRAGQGPGAAAEIPVVFTAAGGGAKLKVRDGQGDLVFDGELAFGQSTRLEVSPPVRVWTSDGSVTATINGAERGALGDTGQETSGTYAGS